VCLRCIVQDCNVGKMPYSAFALLPCCFSQKRLKTTDFAKLKESRLKCWRLTPHIHSSRQQPTAKKCRKSRLFRHRSIFHEWLANFKITREKCERASDLGRKHGFFECERDENNRLFERKISMTKTNEPIRKTVYLEEKLVRQAEILFGEAEVESFSAFVTKAIEGYITKLVVDKNGDLLSKEIRKAIHEEISPTNTRISKGLYRYAIELDMLAQIVAYQHDFRYEEIIGMRKEANKYVAQMRGKINVDELINEVYGEYYDD